MPGINKYRIAAMVLVVAVAALVIALITKNGGRALPA